MSGFVHFRPLRKDASERAGLGLGIESMRKIMMLASLLLVPAAIAQGAPPAQKKDKVVCKRVNFDTGSMVKGKKVCRRVKSDEREAQEKSGADAGKAVTPAGQTSD